MIACKTFPFKNYCTTPYLGLISVQFKTYKMLYQLSDFLVLQVSFPPPIKK